MQIRKATADDFLAILDLIRLFPDKLIQDHLPKPEEFFVALEDDHSTSSTSSPQAGSGQVVGCCALEIYSRRLAEVRSLAVSPQFQNRGIATALIDACVAEAKAKDIYEVLTITGTSKIFEKQGFGTFNNERFALFKVLGK